MEKENANKKNSCLIGAKGFLMGTADIIPGVSGGTIALIFGIYAELIDSIRAANFKDGFNILLTLSLFWRKKNVKILKQAAQALNFGFLLPLILGILSAIIIASRFLPYLIKTYPTQTNGLFFGLISASIYLPFSMIKELNAKNIFTTCIFASAAFFFLSRNNFEITHSLFTLFWVGVVAISAMILPGISGSYILKTLDQYEFILSTLHDALSLNTQAIISILVFISGLICGILVFARILHYALHHFHCLTLSALTGLMIGGLYAVWPFKTAANTLSLPTNLGYTNTVSIILMIFGLIITVTLIFFNQRANAKAPLKNS